MAKMYDVKRKASTWKLLTTGHAFYSMDTYIILPLCHFNWKFILILVKIYKYNIHSKLLHSQIQSTR